MALSSFIPDSSGGYPDEPTATIGNHGVLIQHLHICYIGKYMWVGVYVHGLKKIKYISICMVSVKSEPLLPYSFAGAMGIYWFFLEASKRLSWWRCTHAGHWGLCHIVVKGLSLSWKVKPKGHSGAGTSWDVTVLWCWLNTSFKLRQGWKKSSVVVWSQSY